MPLPPPPGPILPRTAPASQTGSTPTPAPLGFRDNLAIGYQAAGRLDEAIPLNERTLTDGERVLGNTHLDTLDSRNNLADAYEDAGRGRRPAEPH